MLSEKSSVAPKKQKGAYMQPHDIISGFNLSFDQGVAIQCGVNAAIVLNHIIYWLRFNEKNPEAQKDGKIWMYETQEKMSEFLRFLSYKEVRNAVKILLEKNLIVKANFNNNHFVQTNWYSLPDDTFQKVFSKRPQGRIDESHGGGSEAPVGANHNKEEEKAKEKEMPGLAGSENAASEQNFENISFMGRNSQMHIISKSEVYRHLMAKGFSLEATKFALDKLKTRKGEVGDVYKLIELMAADYVRNSTSSEMPKQSVYEPLKERWRIDPKTLTRYKVTDENDSTKSK